MTVAVRLLCIWHDCADADKQQKAKLNQLCSHVTNFPMRKQKSEDMPSSSFKRARSALWVLRDDYGVNHVLPARPVGISGYYSAILKHVVREED